MRELLVEFWNLAIALAFSVGIGAVVLRFYFKKTSSLLIFFFNLLVFIALASWFLSYSLATRMEIDSIALSFPGEVLTGPDYLVVVYAIALAITFGLLLVFHRHPLVVCPLIFGLGIADISGNMNLIQSMNYFAGEAAGGVSSLPPGQQIWHDYYVSGGHLTRISIYMGLTFLALLLFLVSKLDAVKVQFINSALGPRASESLKAVKESGKYLEIASKLVIVFSIFLNEFLIWDLRLSREKALKCYDVSYFYRWSFPNVLEDFSCDPAFENYGPKPVEEPQNDQSAS